MARTSRREQIEKLFPKLPRYRWQQMDRALFDPKIVGWDGVTVLSKEMREALNKQVPWFSYTVVQVFTSSAGDTHKVVLQASDGLRYETVLMANAAGSWTICVSSQIGCAMACAFCATGTMGLKRSLAADEIIDQYRFWQKFLHGEPGASQRISNMVVMGMGEPMANYENVKLALATLLKYADLGPTHMTVSTVGLLPQLEQLLNDPAWPPVRLAISLHSANSELRKKIVPSTAENFLPKLADWTQRYQQTLGNRRHYLTFEYVLLSGVNDSEASAQELAKYVVKTGAKKINVIPYNAVPGKPYSTSQRKRIDQFKDILRAAKVDVTERRPMGDDIAAACGQLVYH